MHVAEEFSTGMSPAALKTAMDVSAEEYSQVESVTTPGASQCLHQKGETVQEMLAAFTVKIKQPAQEPQYPPLEDETLVVLIHEAVALQAAGQGEPRSRMASCVGSCGAHGSAPVQRIHLSPTSAPLQPGLGCRCCNTHHEGWQDVLGSISQGVRVRQPRDL